MLQTPPVYRLSLPLPEQSSELSELKSSSLPNKNTITRFLGCVFFQSMIPFSKRSFVYFWNRRPRSPDEEDCFLVSNRQERFYPTLVATLSRSSWVILYLLQNNFIRNIGQILSTHLLKEAWDTYYFNNLFKIIEKVSVIDNSICNRPSQCNKDM